MALKQPLKDKQLILLSDASFRAAGYAIIIEDDPQQNLQSKRKTYAPISFGSITFNATQSSLRFLNLDFLCGDLFVLYLFSLTMEQLRVSSKQKAIPRIMEGMRLRLAI